MLEEVIRERGPLTVAAFMDLALHDPELGYYARAAQRSGRAGGQTPPDDQGSESFGLTLGNLTPQRARQLDMPSGQTGALITEVDANGPSAGALRQGDVILSVNRQRVSTAAEASRELQQVTSGRLAQILIWRQGQGQVFVTVRKE